MANKHRIPYAPRPDSVCQRGSISFSGGFAHVVLKRSNGTAFNERNLQRLAELGRVDFLDDHDACTCRKPQPGLLLEAARRHDLQLASSSMVGDRWRDIDAGLNAGVRTVLIEFGYREREPARPPAARVGSLREAAEWIVRQID